MQQINKNIRVPQPKELLLQLLSLKIKRWVLRLDQKGEVVQTLDRAREVKFLRNKKLHLNFPEQVLLKWNREAKHQHKPLETYRKRKIKQQRMPKQKQLLPKLQRKKWLSQAQSEFLFKELILNFYLNL